MSVELSEISAEISAKITEWNPLRDRIAKVVNAHLFELQSSKEPIYADTFWNADLDHAILSAAQKERIFLQYHHSHISSLKVLAFALALQELCDSGISLSHEGQPVVDLWVLNSDEFDVSDVVSRGEVMLRYPISGKVTHFVETHEVRESFDELSQKSKKGTRSNHKRKSLAIEDLKRYRPRSYKECTSHWWVAAIIEAPAQAGNWKERQMVHIDICGAAYDDDGFRTHDGNLISLLMFTTAEHDLIVNCPMGQVVSDGMLSRQFFLLSPKLRSSDAPFGKWVHAPKHVSARHFRCFSRADTSLIVVTTLNTFILQNAQHMPKNIGAWYKIIADLRHKLVFGLPKGTTIELCNLEKRPELNGRVAHIHERKGMGLSSDRVSVLTSRWNKTNVLSVRTTCIRLTTRQQYLSHAEIIKRIGASPTGMRKHNDVHMTRRMKREFTEACDKDADVNLAANLWLSGKVCGISLTDPSFIKGTRRMLVVPVFQCLLPSSTVVEMKECLKVADHPKSKEAFQLMRLVEQTKRKAVQKDPSAMKGGGAYLLSTDDGFIAMMHRIGEKIKSDEGLTEIFARMDTNGLFPNPLKDLNEISIISVASSVSD